MWGNGLDQTGDGQGQMAGTCECGNEHSGSIECEKIFDQLKIGQFLEKGSAVWSE